MCRGLCVERFETQMEVRCVGPCDKNQKQHMSQVTQTSSYLCGEACTLKGSITQGSAVCGPLANKIKATRVDQSDADIAFDRHRKC